MRTFKPLNLLAVLGGIAAWVGVANLLRLAQDLPSRPIVWFGALFISALGLVVSCGLLWFFGIFVWFLFDKVVFPKKDEK